MSKRYLMLLLVICLGAGCTSPSKSSVNTVRPTKPEDPEEVPAAVSRLLPEEITAENYKSKILQFERELARDARKGNEPTLAEK